MENLQQRKLLSALSHGSIFFSCTIVSIGIPIAILLLNEDPVVKQNAKEALNFLISLCIYAITFSLLLIIGIGFLLLIVLGLVSLIMPIIAMVKVLSKPDIPYRYPFIFRFA